MNLQIGKVSNICEGTVSRWLEHSGIMAGANSATCRSLYKEYLAFIHKEGFTVVPSLRLFGQVLSRKLPKTKKPNGTNYMILRTTHKKKTQPKT